MAEDQQSSDQGLKTRLSRRQFLQLAAAATVLTACGKQFDPTLSAEQLQALFPLSEKGKAGEIEVFQYGPLPSVPLDLPRLGEALAIPRFRWKKMSIFWVNGKDLSPLNLNIGAAHIGPQATERFAWPELNGEPETVKIIVPNYRGLTSEKYDSVTPQVHGTIAAGHELVHGCLVSNGDLHAGELPHPDTNNHMPGFTRAWKTLAESNFFSLPPDKLTLLLNEPFWDTYPQKLEAGIAYPQTFQIGLDTESVQVSFLTERVFNLVPPDQRNFSPEHLTEIGRGVGFISAEELIWTETRDQSQPTVWRAGKQDQTADYLRDFGHNSIARYPTNQPGQPNLDKPRLVWEKGSWTSGHK